MTTLRTNNEQTLWTVKIPKRTLHTVTTHELSSASSVSRTRDKTKLVSSLGQHTISEVSYVSKKNVQAVRVASPSQYTPRKKNTDRMRNAIKDGHQREREARRHNQRAENAEQTTN